MRSAPAAAAQAHASFSAETAARPWATATDTLPRTPTPTNVLAAVLAVELVTAAAVIVSSTGQPTPTTADLATAAYLAGLGITATIVAVRHATTRGRTTSPPGVDLSPVWTVPAALLLHPTLAAVLVMVLHLHHSRPSPRTSGSLRRRLTGVAAAVLACLAARAAYIAAGGHLTGTSAPTAWSPTTAVLLAVLCFAATNRGVLTATDTTAVVDGFALGAAGREEDLLVVATSSLGGLTAAALAIHPLLVLAGLPAACCLHRAVLVRYLEHTSRLDLKTGLLTAAAWHAQADQVLRRGGRGDAQRAVLVIDLDGFKAVNDTHGHVAGDAVLVAVAGALRAEVRHGDLVGRFGGDEFVVLLTGCDNHRSPDDTAGLLAVAQRIRNRVAALHVEAPTPRGAAAITGLSASIGAALSTDERPELQALFRLADTALYTAKRAGRDTVRVVSSAPALLHGPTACPEESRTAPERTSRS
jgi:diguanylate cyclase (GGDEF)-like protein